MPIYEYYCKECGHEFEVMQKINDNPIRKCEKCGKLKAKKAISRTSFVLKGSGWYVTDYGGGSKAPSEPSPPQSKSESASDTSSKSETTKSDASSKKAASA